MYEYDEDVLEYFLEHQGQLFPEEVASTLEEANEFLSDSMAVVCKNLKEVRDYFDIINIVNTNTNLCARCSICAHIYMKGTFYELQLFRIYGKNEADPQMESDEIRKRRERCGALRAGIHDRARAGCYQKPQVRRRA